MIAEYCGEGILQPMRMIREGDWKYVDVNGHEPLLFNLAEDPHERHNRSKASEASGIEQDLRDRLVYDWDGQTIRKQVVDDQQRRLMLNEALEKGQQCSWDYQPFTDASQQYVRRGFSTQKTKRLQRWPYVPDDPSEI